MADNNPTDFAGWDALSGSAKAVYAAAYTTATSLTSVRTVKIDLSRTGSGGSYSSLATAVSLSTDPTAATTWTWNPVTAPATTQAVFRITDEADATIVQYSAELIIEAAPITIPVYAEEIEEEY